MMGTWKGTSFCTTGAVVTGPALRTAVAAFGLVHAAPDSNKRRATAMYVRRMSVMFSIIGQHALQPDAGQRAADLFQIEFLITLPAKQLLNPHMVNQHAEESSCRQERIDTAE